MPVLSRPGAAAFAVALAAAAAGCAPGPDREHVAMLFTLDARRVPPAAAPADEVRRGAERFAAVCARCHALEQHGQDGLPQERRPDGSAGRRNVPTVFDAARQMLLGWDGMSTDLEAFVVGELRRRCGRGAEDGDDGDVAAEARAIAAFLATLRTRSPWDRYVDGDDAALPPAAREGLRVFLATGCATCHGGRTLGGASAHKLGLAVPWPTADRGRAEVTGLPADEAVFKAPSLLRVAHTGPWLHDGSLADLAEVVRRMAKHELGVELAPTEVASVLEFLRAVGGVDAVGAAR